MNYYFLVKSQTFEENLMNSPSPLDFLLMINQNLNNAHKILNEDMIERLNNLKDSLSHIV